MLDLHALILDDGSTVGLSAGRRLVVANALLGPDDSHVVAIEGCVDDLAHLVARAENTDDIDLLLDVREGVVHLAAEYFVREGLTGITS